MSEDNTEIQLEFDLEPEADIGAVLTKKSDRLNRSLSARASRKKAKAIQKLKAIKAEIESFRIFNKSNGK
jgi:hypothetical protein